MAKRILVVDDTIYNVKLLEVRLQFAAYEVDTAYSGPEALAKMEQRLPDLVLLDVMMPGMDGYEVCRRVRANPKTSRLPIILVTALDKPSDRDTGLQAGADEFLTKPIEDAVLLPTISRFLQAQTKSATN